MVIFTAYCRQSMPLKSLFLSILIYLSVPGNAQVQPAIFGGPQRTSARYMIRDEQMAHSFKTGFMAGAGLKVPFDNALYFFPAIYYSLKGYKVELTIPSFPPTELAKNNNTTIHTIEIAPLFQVDFSKSPTHLFTRFGPALDFVIQGTERFDTSMAGKTIERRMVFSFGDYGRISCAVNVHFGIETSRGLMIFAQYGLGIGSMNNADNGPRILHRIYGISAGWLFGHNPNVIDTRTIR
jgi:hypothetical protein